MTHELTGIPSNSAPSDRYGVVGDPIAHSKSPQIHGEFARATGQNIQYEKFHVTSAEFPAFVRDFFAHGGKGLNVTVPHKLAAAALSEKLTPRAAQAGAVNTLFVDADGKLVGDNTDGAGLVADLRRLGAPLAGARIVIIGAGGAVRGVLGPLLALAPASVWIANRGIERATALIKEFSAGETQPNTASSGTRLYATDLTGIREAGTADLLVQATALGLHGDMPPLPDSLVAPTTFAYDMGYADGATPFESWAKARGAGQVASGIGMLIEQAAEAFFVWRGLRPDTQALHAGQRGSPPSTSNKR